MKKVLIITGSFAIGGSRSSMNALLSVIDPRKVQVDVFSREHVGPLMYKLSNCTILPENIWLSHRIYKGNAAKKIGCRVLYILRGLMQKLGIDLFKMYNHIGGKQIGSDKYDAVIGFDETLPRFVSYIPAQKRITWLHCDYRRHAHGADESKFYDRIDKIVCVSKFAKDTLLEVLPQYEAKTIVIRNAINIEDIIIKSKQVTPEVESIFRDNDKHIFTLISIGRLDPVKQFEKIPSIAAEVKRLLADSQKFQWLIIGGGNDAVKSEIEAEIKKYSVSNEVKLLGMQTNPYKYLGLSDLYVCTSSSETFSYTIHEGLALKVPFLCNTFPSASESVHVGQEGCILPLSEMPAKIVELINNPMKINKSTISNTQLLEDFYNLI